MLDIKKYLSSGIIENYCLGITTSEEASELEAYSAQYPEVRQALEEAQDTLLRALEGYKKEAPEGIQQKILNAVTHFQLDNIKALSESGMLHEFIDISPTSDIKKWNDLTKNIHPPEDFDIHLHPLFEEPDRQLYLVWFKNELPDEVHDDLLESVFVLEGTCVGKMDNETHHLGPGDYMQVPLNVNHTLEVTSEQPIKLILSRVLVA